MQSFYHIVPRHNTQQEKLSFHSKYALYEHLFKKKTKQQKQNHPNQNNFQHKLALLISVSKETSILHLHLLF